MKKLFLIIILLFSTQLHAILPPFYQSVNEIEAILKDSKLQDDADSAYPILEIMKVEGGYIIITSRYQQKIEVKYIPQELMGPAKFELNFLEKNYLDSCY
ncbi:MAG: hypothetical protein KR126chlam6_00314 [Candidatus Anoxychlamydiales bacterium]|nr:hypothetical protein [Candidatus Anoxychlamydiales bacterium]